MKSVPTLLILVDLPRSMVTSKQSLPAAEAAWLCLNTDIAGSLAALPGKRLEIQNRLLARLILLVEYLGEVLAILTN